MVQNRGLELESDDSRTEERQGMEAQNWVSCKELHTCRIIFAMPEDLDVLDAVGKVSCLCLFVFHHIQPNF